LNFKGSSYFQMPKEQFQTLKEKMKFLLKSFINKIDE